MKQVLNSIFCRVAEALRCRGAAYLPFAYLHSSGSAATQQPNNSAPQQMSTSAATQHLSTSAPQLFILILIALLSYNSLQSQTITAKQRDVIIIDNGAPGKADPGDRIMYDVTISNSGGTQGNNTQLNIVPDPRTTFFAGSFKSSPLALDDAYTCTGNVGINVPTVSGVIANDFDDAIPLLTVTAGTFATTQGGSIMLATNGSFMYTPPVGFTGADTYVYTLNDGNTVGPPVPATNTGTITITVSNMIWFIDNTGGGSGGAGTLTSPFKTIADFNGSAGPAINQLIFINYAGPDYTNGIILKNGQTLFGSGHTGGITLADVTPFTMAPNSKVLPSINVTRPNITSPAAGTDGILLASGNIIRGLNVGNSADMAIDDNGAVGTLTISELTINNTTGGGFRTDNGGVLAVSLGALIASGSLNGLNLGLVSGTFSVAGITTINNSTGTGISLTTVSANLSFNSILVGNSGSDGFYINNQSGTLTVAGTTTINAPVAGMNFSLNITGGTGTQSFAGIDINGRRSVGMQINGGNRSITTGNVFINNVNNSADDAFVITGTTGANNLTFGITSINNNNAAGSCIFIFGGTQPTSFAAGSSVSLSNNTEFNINTGSGNVTYNGSVTNNAGNAITVTGRTGGTVDFQGFISHNAAAIAINVASNTGGTTIFSGGTKTINASTATGVSLTSNTGATINFTGGGLVITNSSGTGFTATGGATAINVTGAGNKITTTTATALNVVSTTIGASNLNFQSITSNGSGSANGINLDNTGSSGGLIVTGTGSAGSGGTIANKTGADGTSVGCGIYLNNTAKVSLSRMQLNDFTNYAIRGTSVTDFTLQNSQTSGVNGNNGGADEGSIIFDGLFGTCNFTSNTIKGGIEDNFRIINTNGVLNVTITGNTIRDNSTTSSGNDNINIRANITANITATVTSNIFAACNGDHFQTSCIDDATMNLTFTGNTLSGGGGGSALGQGITISGGAAGSTESMTFNVSNNNMTGTIAGGAININHGAGGGTWVGDVMNNTIGNPAITDSGASQSSGIRFETHGNGSLQGTVSGNTITQWSGAGGGISLSAGDVGADNGTLNVKVYNNTFSNPGANADYCIYGPMGQISGNANVVCEDIANNTMVQCPQGSGFKMRVRARFNTVVHLPGYGGANNDVPALQAYFATKNPGCAASEVSIGNTAPGVMTGGPACF